MSNRPKRWADMTERERRLFVLVPLAWGTLNRIASDIEAEPGGKAVISSINRLRDEIGNFYGGDYRDTLAAGEMDPDYEAREAFTAKLLAEMVECPS